MKVSITALREVHAKPRLTEACCGVGISLGEEWRVWWRCLCLSLVGVWRRLGTLRTRRRHGLLSNVWCCVECILSALHRYWILKRWESCWWFHLKLVRKALHWWSGGISFLTGCRVLKLELVVASSFDLYSEDFDVSNVGSFDLISLLWASHGASLDYLLFVNGR